MNRRPIVIIEDDPGESQIIAQALQQAGLDRKFLRFTAEEAQEYLFERAHQEWTKYDMPAIIILDLLMPGISGLDMLKRIKTTPHTRRLPTLILTNADNDSYLQNSYQLGANSFIPKSPNFQEKIDSLVAYWFQTVALPPV